MIGVGVWVPGLKRSALGLVLQPKDYRVGSGSCSTEYVRGREALRPEFSPFAFIANRNGQCTLQEEEG